MPNFSVPNNISPGDPLDANKAMANWNQVVTDLNSAKVDNTNIAANAGILADQLADAAKLGISGASTVRRGAVSTATAESTSSTTYTTLTTPDKVSSVVLPTNGLIVVAFQAIWQNTVAANARAAIFIGANQLKAGIGTGAPTVQEVSGPTETNDDALLASSFAGLLSVGGAGATTEVTTGQIVGAQSGNGGFVVVFAAAGTYDMSVQFKNSAAGTLTVKNRHLWVWTIGF